MRDQAKRVKIYVSEDLNVSMNTSLYSQPSADMSRTTLEVKKEKPAANYRAALRSFLDPNYESLQAEESPLLAADIEDKSEAFMEEMAQWQNTYGRELLGGVE
jgi:hypothetical protein